jgi:hypothetical protein
MSTTGPVQNTKSFPDIVREEERSGLAANGTCTVSNAAPVHSFSSSESVKVVTPLSMTATTMRSAPPSLMSHARGMLIARRCHCRS